MSELEKCHGCLGEFQSHTIKTYEHKRLCESCVYEREQKLDAETDDE